MFSITTRTGEQFLAKHNRTGFRLNIAYNKPWNNRTYTIKQVEAYAVFEDSRWLVMTVIVKFFQPLSSESP